MAEKIKHLMQGSFNRAIDGKNAVSSQNVKINLIELKQRRISPYQNQIFVSDVIKNVGIFHVTKPKNICN